VCAARKIGRRYLKELIGLLFFDGSSRPSPVDETACDGGLWNSQQGLLGIHHYAYEMGAPSEWVGRAMYIPFTLPDTLLSNGGNPSLGGVFEHT
jgi:hypothetical protein